MKNMFNSVYKVISLWIFILATISCGTDLSSPPSKNIFLEGFTIVDRDTDSSVAGDPNITNTIQINSEIRLTFSHLVDTLSLEEIGTFINLSEDSPDLIAVAVAADMATDGSALTITPLSLRHAQDYQLVIKQGFSVTNDGEKYTLESDLTLNFKILPGELLLQNLAIIDDTGTTDGENPDITNYIQVNGTIRLTFNQPVDVLSPEEISAWVSLTGGSNASVTGNISVNGNDLSIALQNLEDGQNYQIVMKKDFAVTNSTGTHVLNDSLTFNLKVPHVGELIVHHFVTIDSDEVAHIGVPDLTNSIQVDGKISITFNQPMDAFSSEEIQGFVNLISSGEGSTPVSVNMTTSEHVLTITPQQNLRYGQGYQLVMSQGFTVTNAGMKYSLGSDYTLNFNTAPNTDNTLSGSYSNGEPLEIKEGEVILIFLNTDDISAIEVILVVPEGATLSPSNSAENLPLSETNDNRGVFTTNHDFRNDQTYPYTVTAQDGTPHEYLLEAMIRNVTSKEILSFVFASASNLGAGVSQDLPLIIDETAKTVMATVTNVVITNLLPTIIHDGKSISPSNGVAQDFSTNLTYTVTSENDSTTNYTVTLTPYYSVVFDANGGVFASVPPTNYVRYSSNTANLASSSNPTRNHYGFTGWSTVPKGPVYDFNAPITTATTLYAQWTNYRHTIAFRIDSSMPATGSIVVNSLSTLSSANIPAAAACVSSWYIDAGYNVRYNLNSPITGNLTLYGMTSEALAKLISTKVLPTSINGITSSDPVDQERWRSILAPYFPASAGKTIVFRYTTEDGRGSKEGISWNNTWGGTSILRDRLSGITDASVNKVYLVLAAGGNYKPTAGTDRSLSFSLKNYVAVVGELALPSSCGAVVPTVFSGDIGTPGVNTDNSTKVFANTSLNHTAVLYGATITGGYNAGGAGGMYNLSSHITMISVVFSKNQGLTGGGMYNKGSSPTLISVVFSENEANAGGGMYNESSSPTLTGGGFSGNTANRGGGMYNVGSTPTLTSVTLFSNKATGVTGNGGGVYNYNSSPDLGGVTFVGNTALNNGGGMYNDNNDVAGPHIFNSLFWGNTAVNGSQIYVHNNSGTETIQIYYSLVQDGFTGDLSSTGGIGGGFGSGAGGYAIDIYTHDGSASAILSGDPLLGNFSNHGGDVKTISIGDGAARNQGTFVRKDGTTYYYSTDGNDWFTLNNGVRTTVTPSPDSVDIFITDARGYSREGRPDLGAYEYGTTQ